MNVELLVLGSGTSQGVPAIGCACETCLSEDYRDKRLRPSVLFIVDGKSFLIDISSDFRQQMLHNRIERIDAVLMTHHHFDHIGGFDDLRQYNYIQNSSMRIFGLTDTLEEMRVTFRYAFIETPPIGGGVPQVEFHDIDPHGELVIDSISILPIPVRHGSMTVLGYRFGNIAYVTDTNHIPETSLPLLKNLDILILDALRHEPHPTHFHLDQSIEIARRIGARNTFFTHIAHNILHNRDRKLLPAGMDFLYDGLKLSTNGVNYL